MNKGRTLNALVRSPTNNTEVFWLEHFGVVCRAIHFFFTLCCLSLSNSPSNSSKERVYLVETIPLPRPRSVVIASKKTKV